MRVHRWHTIVLLSAASCAPTTTELSGTATASSTILEGQVTIPNLSNRVALDAKRNVLWAPTSNGMLLAISLSTLRPDTLFSASAQIASTMITPGGDTLFVSLANSRSLIAIDLRSPIFPVGTLRIAHDDSASVQFPEVVTLVNNQVLLRIPSGVVTYRTVNVITKSREVWSGSLTAGSMRVGAVTPNGERVLFLEPVAMLYDVAAGREVARISGFANPTFASASLDGNRFSLGRTVLSGSLGVIANLTGVPVTTTSSALSADGSIVYLPGTQGLVEVSVATAAVLRSHPPQRTPSRIIAHPDGQHVLMIDGSAIVVVRVGT